MAPALRRGLGLTLLLAIVGTGLQLIVPILVQQIIDSDVLEEGSADTGALMTRVGLALAAVVLAAVARWASMVRLARSSATGLADLRVTTFGYLHRLSMLHVQSERRGALVARVTSDVETMQHFMEWGGVGMLLGTTQVSVAVIAMLVYQWQLALVVMIGVALYAVLVVFFQRVLRRAHDRVRVRVADSLAAVSEAISGLPTVRAFGMEDSILGKVRLALDRQFRAEYRTGVMGALLFSSAEIFAGLITATVIAVGVVFGDDWGMSAGTLVAFLFLVNLLVEPVQMLVETIDQAQSAGAGLRKILAVLDTPMDLPDPPDGVYLPDRDIDVAFEDVRFRYPTGADALSDVTVDIGVGRRVAVVGETGSGKTTFAKLTTRLLDPAAGTVRLSGVPIDRVLLRLASVPRVVRPAGGLSVRRVDHRERPLRQAGGRRRRGVGCLRRSRPAGMGELHAGPTRDPGRRAREQPVGGRRAAGGPGPGMDRQSRSPRARRGHLSRRSCARGSAPTGYRAAHRRQDVDHHRPPPGNGGGGRRGAGVRPGSSGRTGPSRRTRGPRWALRRVASGLGGRYRPGLTHSDGDAS